MNGWIKLHKKFLDWGWYQSGNTMRVFLHLLLTANFKDSEWMGRTIKRGQAVISLPALSTALNLSIQQIRTALMHLESTSEINRQTTNKYTIVTICKYEDYQGDENRPPEKSTVNQQHLKNIRIKNNIYIEQIALQMTRFDPADAPDLTAVVLEFYRIWDDENMKAAIEKVYRKTDIRPHLEEYLKAVNHWGRKWLTNKPKNIKKIINDLSKEMGRIGEPEFEKIWERYPVKKGRKEAFRHFMASVKSPKDFERINKALDNYLETPEVKRGFLQHGKTWFNNWEDYENTDSYVVDEEEEKVIKSLLFKFRNEKEMIGFPGEVEWIVQNWRHMKRSRLDNLLDKLNLHHQKEEIYAQIDNTTQG